MPSHGKQGPNWRGRKLTPMLHDLPEALARSAAMTEQRMQDAAAAGRRAQAQDRLGRRPDLRARFQEIERTVDARLAAERTSFTRRRAYDRPSEDPDHDPGR